MASITAYTHSNPVFGSNINKIYLSKDGTLNSTIADVSTNIGFIEVHPSNGYNYFGVTNDGIYRHDSSASSAQRASHWIINIPTSASLTSHICAIGMSPDNMLYMYHNLSGYILKSSNYGKTFNIVDTGIANLTGSSSGNVFEFLNQYVYLGMANSQGAYKLSLSSNMWASITGLSGKTVIDIKTDKINNIIYALTNDGIYKSSDYGLVWTNTLTSVSAGYSLVMTDDGSKIFASVSVTGGTYTLYRSINNGSSWSACLTGQIYKHLNYDDINSALYFYNQSTTSIQYSLNDGDSFSSSAAPNVFDMGLKITKESIPTLYGISSTGGLYSTTTLTGWVNTLTADGANLKQFRCITISNANDVFIGGYTLTSSQTTAKIQKLLSGADSWKLEIVGIGEINNIKFDSSSNMWYSIYGSGIFYKAAASADALNYTQKNTGLTNTKIKQLATHFSILWAVTPVGAFKMDTGVASSWTAANTGLTNVDLLSVVGDISATGTAYVGTNGSGIWKTTNLGSAWTYLSLTGHKIIDLMITDNGYIYAASAGVGLYRSIDSGINWSLLYSETSIKKIGNKNSSEFYISAYK